MKAICVDMETDGFPMHNQEVSDPVCGAFEVVVEIRATAVNRADLLQRRGLYPPPSGASPYMGLEMAGVVSALGEGVSNWHVGDRVCALLSGGGYAEKVAVPQDLLMRLPDGWTFEQAAAIPEVFYTAFVNLFMEGDLKPGETVLIHGGASGVGTAAIQLAHHAGCRVLVTAGRDDKVARCLQLGAHVGINYKVGDFFEAVREASPEGVDVILDIAAADYLDRNLKLLKRGGRLVIIAVFTGTEAQINLGLMLRNRLRLIGSVLRSRSLDEKVAIKHAFEERFWPLLVNGTIQPVIDTVLPIVEVEKAHEMLKNNQNIGKVVLQVPR